MNKTGIRLSAALLGYFILIILFLTLNPFYFALPGKFDISYHFSIDDFIINILMFLPVGFFYHLTIRRPGALILGILLSISIEITQFFLPVRTSSITDIFANASGAGVGALLHKKISEHLVIKQTAIGQLKLETPLVGFLYALTPLLFVNSLSFDATPRYQLLTLLLGICGSVVISEVVYNWWQKNDLKTAVYASLVTNVWFFIGTSPALYRSTYLLSISLGIFFVTTILIIFHSTSKERRFERIALKKIIPFFIFYLILLALNNPFNNPTTWHWSVGFTNQILDSEYVDLPNRIEYLAAFTVLGYLLAEWSGRAETPFTKDLPRLILISTAIGLTLELIIGFQIGSGASLFRPIIAIACAIFGGSIYHLVRAHIRFLLGN